MVDYKQISKRIFKRIPVGKTVLMALVVLFVLGVNWQIHELGEQLKKSQNDGVILAEQVRLLGGVPAVTPQPGPTGERGEPGEQGQPGTPGRAPTQAEISAAVSAFLRANPPTPGRPPTMSEILTAVTQYLRENPPPAGPAGEPGQNGADGQDGAPGQDGQDGQDGEPGPPPTAEQIRAAVDEYLLANPLNCPSGFHFETHQILTGGGPQSAALCIED